jgi:hypothetical protein
MPQKQGLAAGFLQPGLPFVSGRVIAHRGYRSSLAVTGILGSSGAAMPAQGENHMKKLAVALLFGSLTIPMTFAAPQAEPAKPTQTDTKKKKKGSKKEKAPKKSETKG